MPTGSRVIVDILQRAGVERVYGVPGEHCLELVDDIGRTPGMEFIATRHESGAAFMAEAEAKLTGVPGVCIGSAGVGAGNLAIGIHTAHQDSTPVIALIGQMSTRIRHREAWQEVDLVSAFTPQAKWAVEISRADRVAELTTRAVRVATSDRPGPVVLSLPEDVQSEPSPSASSALGATPRMALSSADARGIVEAMAAARAPLILLGGGTKGYRGGSELSLLAARTGAGVVVGFRRHDSYPNDDPAYIGAISLSTPTHVVRALEQADLIVAIGTRLSELTTIRYQFPRDGQRLIHIDPSPDVLTAAHSKAEASYVADSELAALALAEAAYVVTTPDEDHPSSDEGRASGGPERAATGDVLERAAQLLDGCLREDAIVTSDAGDFYPPFARAIRYVGERRYLGPTSGAMGYGLPAAIAAALARPGRQVVALVGDGGFMMSLPELETAVRYGLDVVILVANNAQYGSIRRHQREKYDGRIVGVDLSRISFADIARSFGAYGRAIEPAQLPEEIARVRPRGGPAVLELVL